MHFIKRNELNNKLELQNKFKKHAAYSDIQSFELFKLVRFTLHKKQDKKMDEYLYLKLLTLYRNLQLIRKWILHASDKTGQNLKSSNGN